MDAKNSRSSNGRQLFLTSIFFILILLTDELCFSIIYSNEYYMISFVPGGKYRYEL